MQTIYPPVYRHGTTWRTPQSSQNSSVQCYQQRHRYNVDDQEWQDDTVADNVHAVTEQLRVRTDFHFQLRAVDVRPYGRIDDMVLEDSRHRHRQRAKYYRN